MSTDLARPPVPVAAVVVDSGLAHLDRPFEYAVPPDLDTAAAPGVRVRVRFAGRDLDGFVIARRTAPEHTGRLLALRRVVSSEPVLTPELLQVTERVAEQHGGVLGDVLRLAVPPRHATAEAALPLTVEQPAPPEPPVPGPWAAYPAGEALLRRIAAGGQPWAAWSARPAQPPDRDWSAALATAAVAALSGGRGAVIVVPDGRDVARVDAALRALLGRGRHVLLTADQGPQARYTAWLKVLRGHVRCVVGTRAASYAPVRDLGLVAWWDDGDDLHAEPRAPHAHVRDVLAARAQVAGAALLVGGFARSVQVQDWIEQRRLVDMAPAAETVRAAAARVRIVGEGGELERERESAAAGAHLPPAAWRVAKRALEHGPVLVQVPRSGYRPTLRCQSCREPVRCHRCHGPMGQDDGASAVHCRWCGWTFGPAGFECTQCGGQRLRAGTVGSRRTAEELGRAFPGVPVFTSGGAQVLGEVGGTPALVVATPGAEPVAPGGYAACLLLDAWALLDRPELDAAPEALRRWFAAAALTRCAEEGGQVVLAGVPEGAAVPAVEALARWDPVWLARRELAERAALRLPPTVAMAQLTGPRAAVLVAADALIADMVGDHIPHERLGPLAAGPDAVQVLVRVPRERTAALAAAVRAVRATRSARKDPAVLVRLGWDGARG